MRAGRRARARPRVRRARPQAIPTSPAANVQWKLLNDPAQGAAAMRGRRHRPAAGRATTTVTVYERFQMDTTYTQATTGAKSLPRVQQRHRAGHHALERFVVEPVTFVTVPSRALDDGVHVGGFSRPDVWDFIVLSTVESAFEQCTSTGTPAPTCPRAACSTRRPRRSRP